MEILSNIAKYIAIAGELKAYDEARAAGENPKFPMWDMVMPNGKKFHECTAGETVKIGEILQDIGNLMEKMSHV